MADTYQAYRRIVERHETSRFPLGEYEVPDDTFEVVDGSDLFIAREEPEFLDDIPVDDHRVVKTRRSMLLHDLEVTPVAETGIAHEMEVSLARLIADEVVLETMYRHYQDRRDFHIHQDLELRRTVKGAILDRIADVCGEGALACADDAWLDARLAIVRGFPPYGYEEDWPQAA